MWEAIEASREHLKPSMPWAHGSSTIADAELVARRADARWRLREDLTVGVWDKATGRYLGGSGLHRIEWTTRRFEIGYWIRVEETGKGLMTEAVRLLCGMAFGPLNARRVIIRCAVDNHKSAAIPIRVGFVEEGVLKNDATYPDGRPQDIRLFAMTPDLWAKLTSA